MLISGLGLNAEIKGAVGSVALKQLYLRLNLKLAGWVIDCSVCIILTLPSVAGSLSY